MRDNLEKIIWMWACVAAFAFMAWSMNYILRHPAPSHLPDGCALMCDIKFVDDDTINY